MGTITGYGSKHSHEFKLTVNETSTSTANNTSEISFSFTIYKASYSWSNWKSITYSISINGTSYSGTIPSYSAGSTLTIRTGSQTIGHNSDGTKSINYSFSVNDGSGQSYTCGNASASGSMNLSTIPRHAKASISLNSKTVNSVKLNYSADATIDGIWVSKNGGAWESGYALTSPINVSGLSPNTKYTLKIRVKRADSQLYSESNSIEVTTHQIATLSSVPNVNIGSAHTITWANPSGTTTSLKLCKTDNSTIIDYGTVTGTSKSITPTASKIYALTPNSNTYKARYIITTTANGKSYTNSKDFTFTVTNSNPTFSNFTYQDTNTTITALTGNNQILVSGYSNIKATISTANKATAKNSATMKSYKLLVGTKNTTANYNSSADVNMSINQVNNNVIDLYAIDSRGNSTKVSKTATIKKYSNIKIKSLSATRQNNIGTITTLNFEGEFWNASFGSVANAITSCKYKYKTTSSSTWIDGKTTLTYTISGNKITGSLNIQGDAGTDGFSVANSFDIQLVLADKLSSATYNIILTSGNPAIAVYKNNVAIGQQYNTSEGSKFQVNGDISLTNRANGININGHKGILRHWTNDSQMCANNGTIYLRPKGDENTTNQVMINNDGSITASKFNGKASRATMTDKLECINGRITNANIAHSYENDKAHLQLLLATSAMTSNKPAADGYILHGSWDNSGQYNGQVYFPNSNVNVPLQFRGSNDGAWGNWESIYRCKTLYDNSSGTTGTVTLNETSANFAYLEIFYGKSEGNPIYRNSVKVNAPNGKIANLLIAYNIYSGSMSQLQSKCVSISGTSVANTSNTTGYVNLYNGRSVEWGNSNEIKIYKIIGYR